MTRPPLLMYIEGEVTPSERAALEAQLRDDPAVCRELESVRTIIDGLRSHDELSHIDLAPAVRAAIASPTARPLGRPRRVVAVALAAAAALAALALLWISRDHGVEELRVKRGAIRTDVERWSGLGVYQQTAEGGFRRVDARVARSGPLAFTYTNVGPTPFRYLVVVGIDAKGEHYRYYPAETDDTAISIQPGSAVQLPDLVEHDLATGAFVIYAVFANQPIAVSLIETELAGGRALFGTFVQRIDLEVEP